VSKASAFCSKRCTERAFSCRFGAVEQRAGKEWALPFGDWTASSFPLQRAIAMTDVSTNAPESTATRRDRILRAAAEAFATHGYRGSSLRDIARDAGCSLTLLDHHFGGKAQLLDAVLDGQHRNCERRLKPLRDALDDSVLALDDFLARWVNYEFDHYTTPDGRLYLNLLLRLTTEADIDAARRRDLDCAQVVLVKAFARARPSLDDEALENGWRLAAAALHAAVVAADEHVDLDAAGAMSAARRTAIAFLVNGLEGCWGIASDSGA
jgi:AcrR family transcriptional regulator